MDNILSKIITKGKLIQPNSQTVHESSHSNPQKDQVTRSEENPTEIVAGMGIKKYFMTLQEK